MNRVLLTVIVAVVFTSLMTVRASADLVEITAEGKAAGDVANAREQALTDALREAVRTGAGVDVLSTTGVRDFVLEYDRVFAASFGYVRNYSVLSSGLGNDGIYRVKIRAEVGEGQPDMQDAMALKMIVNVKQSPRVSLETDELIEGAAAGSDFAKVWFESAAREMQMNLVDVTRMTRQENRLAARDEFLGDKRTAELRRLDLSQKTDFIIQAKVRGRYLGKESFYGSIPTQKFSVAVDLRAIWPDTGQVLVSLPMEGRELDSSLEAPDTAARDIVHRVLSGGLHGDYPGAWGLFRRIFASWIAELDLGTIMKLEFNQMTDAEHDRIMKVLGETEKTTSVWPREFDSKGLTYIDVESRLDATGLKTVVLKTLGDAYVFDHATRHYLQFRRSGIGQSSVQAVGQGDNAQHSAHDPQGSTTVPPWAWTLIGAGGVAVLFGIYSLGRRAGGKGQ
jgi:hypothetical protein